MTELPDAPKSLDDRISAIRKDWLPAWKLGLVLLVAIAGPAYSLLNPAYGVSMFVAEFIVFIPIVALYILAATAAYRGLRLLIHQAQRWVFA